MKKFLIAAGICFALGMNVCAEANGGIFFENFGFSVNGTKIDVTGKIDNKGNRVNGILIAAAYDDKGRLTGIAKKDVTAAGLAETDVDITLNTDKASENVSCFLWNDISKSASLTPNVDYKNGSIDYNRHINEYFVSASADKNGDGSRENPFNSIEAAKEYIRTEKYKINEDITVNIAAGEYSLAEPLTFDYEDSGAYGNKIIYKGDETGETLISGGEKLTGWTSEGGNLYSISLPNREYVRELYADNKVALRAHNEELIYPQSYYNDGTAQIGLVFNKDKGLESIKSGDGANLTSLADWRYISLKISKVEEYPGDRSKIVVYFEDGEEAVARLQSNYGLSQTERFGVHIENAMGFLDTANEFYFDRDTKKLYYMTENGENPDDLNVYIPNLEKIILIRGNHSKEKVSNLEFSNLTFQYTKWDRMEKSDYVPYQGAAIRNDDADNNYNFPQNGVVPAAIQIDTADNIVFKKNVVACSANNGIGIYNDVDNSDISGNIVTETAHGGITVGLPGHMYEDSQYGYNVAYRKPVTESSHTNIGTLQMPASNLTDGDMEYGWLSGETDGKSWFIIDLGDEYNITGIGIHTWGAQTAEHRNNFKIYGSNKANFSFKSTIKSVTSELPGGLFSYLPADKRVKCRYIKYEKTGSSGLGDISIFTDSVNAVSKDGCENDIVSNNYISNVGKTYLDAVSVHAFYTNSLTISNNTIMNSPYTSISLGWGWTRTPYCTLTDNNKILNNKIIGSNEKARDGAGIYTIGHQPNMIIKGNYISDVRNMFGGIYPDEGTNGVGGGKQSTIQITENVVENSPMWFHGWQNSIGNMNITGNYTTTDVQKNYMDASTISMSNKLYIAATPPSKVRSIKDTAGVSAEYRSILDKLAKFGQTAETYDMENVVSEAGGINLVDEFTLAQPGKAAAKAEEYSAEFYINAGNKIEDPSRATSGMAATTKSEHLTSILRTYDRYTEMFEAHPTWLKGYETQKEKLDSVFADIEKVYNKSISQYDIFDAKVKGEKALAEFEASGVFKGRMTTSTIGSDTILRR